MDGPGPVGRDREMSALVTTLDEVRRGAKRVVVLVGEPGVGKSTLLAWALMSAERVGFSCAAGRMPSVGGLPPLFPLPELIGQLEQGPLADELADKPPAESAGEPTDVLSLVAALERVASSGPLAIFVDDVQWAPQEGLSLLYSALRLAQVRAFVVLTLRSAITNGPLPVSTSDLPVDFMIVRGLDLESLGELAARLLRGPVLPSLANALFERTLGNPLLVYEMVRSWRDSLAINNSAGGYWGLAEPHGIPESRSLLEMVSARLKSLEPTSFACATALALLGRGCPLAELRSLLGLSIAETVNALAGLEASGIVERKTKTGRYLLAHPLFQSALVQDLGATRKADMHTRIFNMMAKNESSSAAEIAYHGVRALERPQGLSERLLEAALEAEEVGTYAQAAMWYEKLTEVTEDSVVVAGSLVGRAAAAEHFDPKLAVEIYSNAISSFDNTRDRTRLLIGRSRAWRMAGRPDAALRDLEEAAAGADKSQSLEIRDAMAVIHAVLGHSQLASSQFAGLAEESKGTRFHARVLGHLAAAAYFRGQIRKAANLSREALSYCDDLESRQYLHTNLGWFETLLGEWGEARILLDEAIDSARKANDLWFLVPLMTSATVLAVWQGELDRALDLSAQAWRITDETYMMDRLGALGALGLVLLEKGLIPAAAELLASAPEMADSSSEKNEVQLSLLVLGDCLLRLGDQRGCEVLIAQLRGTLEFNLSWAAATDRLEAQLLSDNGKPEEALLLIDGCLQASIESPVQAAEAYFVEARILQVLGRHDEARSAAAMAFDIYSGLRAQSRMKEIDHWLRAYSGRSRGRPKARIISNLTLRELEILGLVVTGATNSEIAAALFISVGTVKKHIENIRLKIGAGRRSELISMGLPIVRRSRQSQSV